MLGRHGHHQAEREDARNASRSVALAERAVSGGDIWLYAERPRNV